MARAVVPMRAKGIELDPAAPLVVRTRRMLEAFDGEVKDYAFLDGGDGTTYAEWFADLLDEWLDKGDAGRLAAMRGSVQAYIDRQGLGPDDLLRQVVAALDDMTGGTDGTQG